MAFTQALCPVLQRSLYNVAGANTGYLTRQQTGLLDALMSPINRAGFEQIEVGTPNGGRRLVEITYIQAGSPGDVASTEQGTCAGGNEKAPYVQTIDPAVMQTRWANTIALTEEELGKICFASSEEYRAQVLMSMIQPVVSAINTRLWTDLITPYTPGLLPLIGNAGRTVAPSGPLTTDVYTYPARILTAAPDPVARYQGWSQDVKNRLRKSRMYATPLVVGAGVNGQGVSLYADLKEVACCNERGIDLSRANNDMYYFYDYEADNIAGATALVTNDNTLATSGTATSPFLAFQPGSLQLVTWNKYGGDPGNPRRKREVNHFERDTIIDPYTGLEFDFKLNYDNCDDVWRMTIGTHFMLWAPPRSTSAVTPFSTPMYQSTDPMLGVNGVLLFDAQTV